MDRRSVLGLDSADADRLFGQRMSLLLSICDLDHPDLSCGPAAEFVRLLEQSATAFRLCIDHGLEQPASLILEGVAKVKFDLSPMVRVFRESHRQDARSRKSTFWIPQESLSGARLNTGRDFPSSFWAFSSSDAQSDAESTRWSEMARTFEEFGCDLLADMSRSLSSEGSRDSCGLARLPILRAAVILGRRMGRGSDGLRAFVSPCCRIRLPEEASESVRRTESILEGRPAFDHHIVVSYSSAGIPIEIERDFVVLGERDGLCYFVYAD